VQSDPIGFGGGVNTYAYGNSSPLTNFGRTGIGGRSHSRTHRKCSAMAASGGRRWVAGWEIGNLLNPYIQPAISSAIDWCTKEDPCEQLLKIDTKTCNGITRRRGAAAGAACHASAADRYAACLRGQPLPPVNTWNN
jgi:hypothetical protein